MRKTERKKDDNMRIGRGGGKEKGGLQRLCPRGLHGDISLIVQLALLLTSSSQGLPPQFTIHSLHKLFVGSPLGYYNFVATVTMFIIMDFKYEVALMSLYNIKALTQ